MYHWKNISIIILALILYVYKTELLENYKITFKSLIIYFTAIELLKFQLSICQEISKKQILFLFHSNNLFSLGTARSLYSSEFQKSQKALIY